MTKELEALEKILNKFVEILLETKCEEPTAVNITYLTNSLRVAFHNELDLIETALKDLNKHLSIQNFIKKESVIFVNDDHIKCYFDISKTKGNAELFELLKEEAR